MLRLAALLLMSLPAVAFAQAATTPAVPPPTRGSYLRIAADVEKSLQQDDLQKFFPAAIDPAGGFFETFDQSWNHTNPARDTTRSVVYQSRLTWLAAQAAMRYPEQASTYLPIVRHGVAFLTQRQWDAKNGGFWWSVNVAGQPRGDSKHIYGNAFAIYALAAAFQATHDAATNTVRLTTIYEERDPGEPVVRWIRRDEMRLVGVDELRGFAEAAGLVVESIAGGYDMEPHGPGAERAILVAARP